MATIRDAVNATATSASRPPNRRQKALTEQHQREDAARLRAFAAFDNFSDRELLRLAQASHHHSTSTAWPLIHEHTPSDACYILLSGEVGVYVGHDRIATLGPGEVIGESALRTGRLRSATVTTTGAAEVLRIGRDDLARLLDEIPALRATIDATVTQHVPVAYTEPPTKAEPQRSKVHTSVPTEVVKRFEHAAQVAGVSVADALEDALTQWTERNGGDTAG